MANLTDLIIRNARPGERDLQLTDGAGLVLRVGRGSGAKSFWYRYKKANGSKWVPIGPYPTVSLKEARALAADLTVKRKQGIDPLEAREEAERQRVAEAAQRKAEEAAQAARLTVLKLFERWERLELSTRKDKGAEVRRYFEKDVLPVIGSVHAEDVTRTMVAALLDTIVERGARVVARNTLSALRQMFGFGIKRGLVDNDPTAHLKRDDFGRRVERDRVLSEAEITQLAGALPSAGMRESTVAVVWILLATCCRVGEIVNARTEHLDLDAGEWWIPPANSKNGKAHKVYLSTFAQTHFRQLTQRAQRLESDWLVTAADRSKPIDPKNISKQVGDRQRVDQSPHKARTTRTTSLTLPGGRWTPHDLRRSGATLMGAMGVRPDVIEKCLNHVEQNRMVRIYQRQELRAEQRQAWQLLGDRLALLAESNTARGRVIVLQRGAA